MAVVRCYFKDPRPGGARSGSAGDGRPARGPYIHPRPPLPPVGFKKEDLPIPRPTDEARSAVENAVRRPVGIAGERGAGVRRVLDWLRLEFGIEKPTQRLHALTALDADGLIGEVKKVRGRKAPLSVADVKRLRAEHVASVKPLRALERGAGDLERQVSDRVNAGFGLTEDDVRLLWETAPPRMPIGRCSG